MHQSAVREERGECAPVSGEPVDCPETVTPLSPEEALLILEYYFEAAVEVFSAAGFRKVERARLYCAPWVHDDSPRHFAACREDGRVIIAAPELVELPPGTVGAILAHELGHVCDFAEPGRFALGKGGRAEERSPAWFGGEREWARWVRHWKKERDEDTVELTADAIAELATGRRIGYLGPCSLQCFDRGLARPIGLR